MLSLTIFSGIKKIYGKLLNLNSLQNIQRRYNIFIIHDMMINGNMALGVVIRFLYPFQLSLQVSEPLPLPTPSDGVTFCGN